MTSKSKTYFRVCILVFILSAILFSISIFSETFAEFCTLTVCAFTRYVTSFISSFFPFSLAEILVMVGIPAIIVYGISISVLVFKRKREYAYINLKILLGSLMMFASLYFLNIGISYHRVPIEDNLDLERKNVSIEQLVEGATIFSDNLSMYIPYVEFDSSGASVMPYSFNELSDKLNDAYEKLSLKYDFIINVNAPSKRIALSDYMTYTHISGVYMPITGEANVNTNYPDYVVTFSTAHEKAHQRGIAGEDEANFIAYLACMQSDDTYIRYSALMSMFDYYLTALLKSDTTSYYDLIKTAPDAVVGEMKAYYDFFKKYSSTQASKIVDKVNDTHLKLQGQQDGTISYGLVVELAESYRIKNEKTP